MKMRHLLILLVLLSGLVLWATAPATVFAQQADGHEGQDHASHNEPGHTEAEGHAGKHYDHADHDHGAEAHKRGDEDHAEHGDDDEGHDDHAGHGHEGEEGGIRIAPEVLREFGIEIRKADGVHIEKVMRLPGEVSFNADRIAHVTPTVIGIARRVNVTVGDRVEQGQVLAVLSSRELAEVRSEYLAAQARFNLATEIIKRDERLFHEKVGTERAAIESRQAHEEARITLQHAETSLHALGLHHEHIDQLTNLDHAELSRYELVSPLDGIVTSWHLTVGEIVEPTSGDAPLVVADLSTVWVNLTVYQRDLAHVNAGQHVTIRFGHGIPDAEGEIAFISPSLEEKTRTATARVVLKNPDGHWRPGLFVEGRIETGRASASVVVPRSAITEIDGKQAVFVQTDEGFEPREVTVGRTTPESAEVVAGLKPGERYVARNVLALKAEMNRAALEHAGHAH